MKTRRRIRLGALVLVVLALSWLLHSYGLTAWVGARLADPPPALPPSPPFRVEVVVEGLESPWALAFPEDGRILITERPGRLRVVRDGRLDPEPVPGVPEVDARGQGGLLDIALHPDHARNRWLYLAYTGDHRCTVVARFHDTPEGLRDAEMIFPGVPGGDTPKHFGCRLAFGPDGMLYVTLGERHERGRAQDRMDLNGKTLRLTPEGGVPPDNPFAGRRDARPEIFSIGHRNAQGMAFQPGTGLLYQTEHGPSWDDKAGGGDEVNLVTAGRDYGWPVAHHRRRRAGMDAPVLEYTPAIAPSGACFYEGDVFPEWWGDFFFAALRGRALYRVRLSGREVMGQERLLVGRFGRLRDVGQGRDGFLYVLTSDTDAYGPGRPGGDRLLRLVPAR